MMKKEEDIGKRCKLRAMNLLMKHAFTERDLRTKLTQGGYPDDIVDEAIEYVRSFGYIDDAAYAYDYVSSHMEDKSIRRITYDLSNKGIDASVIEDAIARVNEADGPIDEETQIRRLLKKRHFDPSSTDSALIGKTVNYLLGKGYSYETIKKAISVFEEDLD